MFYVELTYGNYFSSPVFCFNLSSEELLDVKNLLQTDIDIFQVIPKV